LGGFGRGQPNRNSKGWKNEPEAWFSQEARLGRVVARRSGKVCAGWLAVRRKRLLTSSFLKTAWVVASMRHPKLQTRPKGRTPPIGRGLATAVMSKDVTKKMFHPPKKLIPALFFELGIHF
jgi:hypothetical protein